LEFNKSLNGKYEFKLLVDKNSMDTQRYNSEIEEETYDTLSQLLDEISEKEF